MENAAQRRGTGRSGHLPIPSTFGGVSAFAGRSLAWLAGWQALVALAAALVAAWALQTTWARSIWLAADALPDAATINQGRLVWNQPAPAALHHGPFLSVVVDPDGLRESGLTADLTLSLEREGLGLHSIFGWFTIPYPPDGQVALTRMDFTGFLTAWTSPALVAVAAAVFVGLLVSWALMATVYAVVLWSLAGLISRWPKYRDLWKLAGASLLPGALLMTAAIVLYVSRQLSLVGLLLVFPLHFVVGWIYCLGGLTRLPKPVRNPFDAPESAARRRNQQRPANPFQSK